MLCPAGTLRHQYCRQVHPGPCTSLAPVTEPSDPKDGALAVVGSWRHRSPFPCRSLQRHPPAPRCLARSLPARCELQPGHHGAVGVHSARVGMSISTTRPSETEFQNALIAHARSTEPSLILCRQKTICNHLTQTAREQPTLAQATARGHGDTSQNGYGCVFVCLFVCLFIYFICLFVCCLLLFVVVGCCWLLVRCLEVRHCTRFSATILARCPVRRALHISSTT